MKVTRKVCPFCAAMENLPSVSDNVAVVVPAISMVAPGSASPFVSHQLRFAGHPAGRKDPGRTEKIAEKTPDS